MTHVHAQNEHAAKLRRRHVLGSTFPLLSLVVIAIVVITSERRAEHSKGGIRRTTVSDETLGTTTPSRQMPCLDCDILGIEPPPYPVDGDWNIRSACALPQNSGNRTQIVDTLSMNEERCLRSKCSVWIAYVGDSLLRSPFNHLVDILMGHDWPIGGDCNTFNLSTYHVDHRVCCRVFDTKEHERLQCSFSRAFDTPQFVRDFFQATDHVTKPSRDICITWQWNRLTIRHCALLLLITPALILTDGYHTRMQPYHLNSW